LNFPRFEEGGGRIKKRNSNRTTNRDVKLNDMDVLNSKLISTEELTTYWLDIADISYVFPPTS